MTTTATRPSYRGFFTEVADVIDLSQTFRRLVLSGPDLHEFGDAMLDQRIKLILATGRQAGQWPMHDAYAYWRSLADHVRPAMRTYTVAGIDHDDVSCWSTSPVARFTDRPRSSPSMREPVIPSSCSGRTSSATMPPRTGSPGVRQQHAS